MKPSTLDAIDVTEKVHIAFPYLGELETGETIADVAISIAVKTGTDATPQATLVGAPVVMPDTSEVLQFIQGRLAPVTYKFKCVATLSSGRVLTRLAEIAVVDF
jgi:hypothetical protein